jgi:hydrogenase nickel incorporation protein HypA/HybF
MAGMVVSSMEQVKDYGIFNSEVPAMHEWSLADAVVASVMRELKGRNPGDVSFVRILIGELQAVDREIFRFWLSTLFEPYGIGSEKLVIETEKAVLHCGSCGLHWDLAEDPSLDEVSKEAVHFLPEAAHAFIRCPSCGSVDFSVEKGRGVSIESIGITDTPKSAP